MKIIISMLSIFVIIGSTPIAVSANHIMSSESTLQDPSQNAAWIKWLESSMAITSNDVTMLSGNISQKDKGELKTILGMIWKDLDTQEAALKNHPAPKDLMLAANDYNTALGWLRSSIINFQSFALGRNAPVIGLGNNPTHKGQPDNIANGLSNLNSCKIYLTRVVDDVNLTKKTIKL